MRPPTLPPTVRSSLRPAISASLLATCLWLAGCNLVPAPQADPTRFYVLAASTPTPAATPATRALHLRPVEVANYLRGRPLVVRRGEHEVQFRDFARWGEPLEEGVARVLREEWLARGAAAVVSTGSLRSGRPAAEAEISVRLLACEGGVDGTATVAAAWDVRGPDGLAVLRSGVFRSQGLRWDGRNEASLAAALSQGVSALAAEVAAGWLAR